MIRFESIRVINFALFPDLTLTFSTNPELPLTVLRGENDSGKTTLLRAFLWTLFGREVLPRIPNTRHAVRPVWATPGQKVHTRVEVRFRVETEKGLTMLRLSRSVDTEDDGTKVDQGPEQVVLFRRDGDDWQELSDDLPILRKQYFRIEMRDFYFIDADKALEYVGGPEGRHSDELMRQTATQSIRALLGLDTMRKATERLEDRHLSFSRNAGCQSSNLAQRTMAEELQSTQDKLAPLKEKLSDLLAQEKGRVQALKTIEAEYEDSLAKLPHIESTNRRYEEVTQNLADSRLRQSELINSLVQRLDDERLFSALMLPAIDNVMNSLQPLKDQGYIPPSELTLLPRLLERGSCVCGTPLPIGGEHRKRIERQIHNVEKTDNSGFLNAALEGARSFGNRLFSPSDTSWHEETESTLRELAHLEPDIARLVEQRDTLREEREKNGTGGAILELKKQRDELQHTAEAAREERERVEREIDDLQIHARSLSERIRTAATAEKRTQFARNCADVADDLRRVIGDAYEVIEREQVIDVSRSMNKIFRDVITATAESLFGEVGIRAVSGDRLPKQYTQYELYSHEGGREKPLALANGASRRAIGVAFVLALAEETGTKVPLVADSLLHAMSGSVKRKVVDYLSAGNRVGQPVLFGTRADFLDHEVLSLLRSRAGQFYTLTSQAHAGGDVVRATPAARYTKQVVVCDCGIDEFCPTCERAGDLERAAQDRLIFRSQSHVLA